MSKKSIVYNFSHYDKVELLKTFPLPYYIGKQNNMSVTIVYRADEKSKDLAEYYRGVHFCPLKFWGVRKTGSLIGEWYFLCFFYMHAHEIDVLIRPHFSYLTIIIGWIYKLRNPKGIFYIFSDGYGLWAALFRKKTLLVNIKNFFIKKILYKACNIADKISVELVDIYNFYKIQEPLSANRNKLIHMRLGIDEEILNTYDIKEYPINQKEKLIISVGRHGSKQKNTELFLDALKNIDLKDYSVVFIGPVEKEECDFQSYIDTYFVENKELKEKVHFVGAVYDKKELYSWFNRSKIFVHTAIYESYGIVIGEAFRFNNYILSTDVGCAKELISMGMGELYPMNDANMLAFRLQQIIDGEIDIQSIYESKPIDNKIISWENEVKKLGRFK